MEMNRLILALSAWVGERRLVGFGGRGRALGENDGTNPIWRISGLGRSPGEGKSGGTKPIFGWGGVWGLESGFDGTKPISG